MPTKTELAAPTNKANKDDNYTHSIESFKSAQTVLTWKETFD